jgi:PAS domain S-box-containing protein
VQFEKLANVEIKRQRDLTQKYLDVVSVILLILDGDANIELLNSYGCALLGYTADELIGKNWTLTCVPEESRKVTIDKLIRTTKDVTSQKMIEYKNNVLTKDGEVKTILWRNSSVNMEDDIKVICSGVDITEKEKLEQRKALLIDILKLLNIPYSGYETLKSLIGTIKGYLEIEAVAIRLSNNQDYPYFVSEGFSESFLTAENLLCNNFDTELDCICGCVIQERCSSTSGLKNHITALGSFWTNHASAMQVDVNFSIRCVLDHFESIAIIPLKTASGVIGTLQLNDTHVDMFSKDLILFLEELALIIAVAVQRSQQEDRIRGLEIAKTRDLLQSSRMLNSGIAHELRTPMQAMLNCLELIKDEITIDCDLIKDEITIDCDLKGCSMKDALVAKQDSVFSLIEDGVDRAKYSVKVLNSLSEYSKIATDKEVNPIDIVNELNLVIKTLRFTDQFKSVPKDQLRLESLAGVGSCLVSINRVDFSQLIINLCRNSIEAIDHDNPEIIIQVEVYAGRILIKVVDNGRGIDPSLGDKIFEPYFSTKSNPENYNQGLGLAMVRDIILAYGGSVNYNSVPGRTEFIVSFPCEH